MTRRIATFVACFIVWCLLAYPYSEKIGWDLQSLFTGLLVSAAVAALFSTSFTQHPTKLLNPVRWFYLICYIPVFIYYVIQSNLQVMYLVLHPDLPIRPGVVKVKTRLRSSTARTMLANSITLTPGTMTVDVTDDGYLYIHWLVVESSEMKAATHKIVDHFEGWIEKIFE